ncbi:hypothetical protein GGR52DRAFT_240918 [Hypoxylon sp. FL1284]|nr:hypothetical protein GGR52DRAFT_240918 [Hypoxylon sp. FL1284]
MHMRAHPVAPCPRRSFLRPTRQAVAEPTYKTCSVPKVLEQHLLCSRLTDRARQVGWLVGFTDPLWLNQFRGRVAEYPRDSPWATRPRLEEWSIVSPFSHLAVYMPRYVHTCIPHRRGIQAGGSRYIFCLVEEFDAASRDRTIPTHSPTCVYCTYMNRNMTYSSWQLTTTGPIASMRWGTAGASVTEEGSSLGPEVTGGRFAPPGSSSASHPGALTERMREEGGGVRPMRR